MGTAMLRMGAARVLVTDLPKQQWLIRQNLRANLEASPPTEESRPGGARRPRVHSCSLVWGDMDSPVLRERWDLVVGCDVVYDLGQVPHLADTLTSLLEGSERSGGDAGGTRVLLALPDRDDFGYKRRDGSTGEWTPTLPDYEVLLADLEKRMPGRLDVVLLDSIPPGDAASEYADCGTSVHVILLSRSSMEPARP